MTDLQFLPLRSMFIILSCHKLLTTMFKIVIIFTPCVKTDNQILDECITMTGQSKGMPCHFPSTVSCIPAG